MQYITIQEVVQMTGLKYGTVREWAKDGTLPCRIIKHGKKAKYLFKKDEIIEWVERHKTKPF